MISVMTTISKTIGYHRFLIFSPSLFDSLKKNGKDFNEEFQYPTDICFFVKEVS